MNWDRVEGNWKTFKGQVQQKWGKLTDDDLDVIEGKRTELSGRLQIKRAPVKQRHLILGGDSLSLQDIGDLVGGAIGLVIVEKGTGFDLCSWGFARAMH